MLGPSWVKGINNNTPEFRGGTQRNGKVERCGASHGSEASAAYPRCQVRRTFQDVNETRHTFPDQVRVRALRVAPSPGGGERSPGAEQEGTRLAIARAGACNLAAVVDGSGFL